LRQIFSTQESYKSIMGKQYNKVQKRGRRLRYLKRKAGAAKEKKQGVQETGGDKAE